MNLNNEAIVPIHTKQISYQNLFKEIEEFDKNLAVVEEGLKRRRAEELKNSLNIKNKPWYKRLLDIVTH